MIERAMLGTAALGRALDAEGDPLDGLPRVDGIRVRLGAAAISPGQRCAIVEPLWTGVRCIDALLTIGRGARIGLFGSPGAGKSTLLEAIAHGVRADAVVVGLIGERGREAQRWIAERDERITVICATGDRPAHERIRAAEVFIAQAQALASRGLHVLAVLDSLARYANALREVAVAGGESVGRGGYPPSVFTANARLVERAGAFSCGSVTMIATVLNDGDDHDPVSENARSLLDGHVQLSPRLAHAGRFPAIDVPASASRTMDSVVTVEHRRAAVRVRAALALLARCEDARALGLDPADPASAAAIAAEPALEALLRQGPEQAAPIRTLEALRQTADMLEEAHGYQL
ncbi:MAG TPA: ATP-binding cassette domain-containing protein [Candidatus Acidoferrum sp.]|jgi:FliI/YscN family ATPase|nr:ATP-binding cassette domain-containing protein [Candidatus Acidoferrum sp.]